MESARAHLAILATIALLLAVLQLVLAMATVSTTHVYVMPTIPDLIVPFALAPAIAPVMDIATMAHAIASRAGRAWNARYLVARMTVWAKVGVIMAPVDAPLASMELIALLVSAPTPALDVVLVWPTFHANATRDSLDSIVR
jgi:hypothetical protein